jgi:hypothetical protein
MPDVVDHPVGRHDVAQFVVGDQMCRPGQAAFRQLRSIEDEHEVRRPGRGRPHDPPGWLASPALYGGAVEVRVYRDDVAEPGLDVKAGG